MKWMAFAPELYCLLASALVPRAVADGRPDPKREHRTALFLALLGVIVSLAAVGADGYLFEKAYRVDLFSQIFKVMLSTGLFLITCMCGKLTDIRDRAPP